MWNVLTSFFSFSWYDKRNKKVRRIEIDFNISTVCTCHHFGRRAGSSFFAWIHPLTVCLAQGWEVSRYSVGRTWIDDSFCVCICVEETIFGYRGLKRHFFIRVKILWMCRRYTTLSRSRYRRTNFLVSGTALAKVKHLRLALRQFSLHRLHKA